MAANRRGPIRDWLARFWADLKSSTDPGLLGAARFLGLLYGPIDRERPIDRALRKALGYRLPRHVGWRHAFGGITYFLFILLVITGVLLSFYYRPSAQEAYPSVQHIISDTSLGWLVRDLHVWSANLIVVAILAHMARVLFAGAYKPPRETSWLVGLLLLFVVLAFGATGYLLPWDQWAYWTVSVGLEQLGELPVLGPMAAELLRGDVLVSGATLSRFFALHVIVLPWVAFALLVFHFAMVRRHGIAPPPGEPVPGGAGTPFFPNHLLRSLIVTVLVFAVAISLAVLYPRPVADPATPFEVPRSLVSTWVVVDVSLALVAYLGPWGFAAFTLLGVGLALLPLFDRRPETRIRRRPVVAGLGLVFFLAFAVAWLAGRRIESVPVPRSGDVVEDAGRPLDVDETVGGLPPLGPEPQRPAPDPAARPAGNAP